MVKVVLGSAGEGEHHHEEDYWEVVSVDKLDMQKKIVKRRMRKPEYSQIDLNYGENRNQTGHASTVKEFLARELSHKELKSMFKIARDIPRKNHYQHMHTKPVQKTPVS